MAMKVVILGIDGVLNSYQYLSRTSMEDAGFCNELDPQKVELLQKLVVQTGASIVLSSSWRESFENMMPLDFVARNLLVALKEQGLSISSMTPLLTGKRDEEIRQWLTCHTEVERFVILDDEDYNWKELRPNWVETSYYMGLTEKNVREAVKILNKK